MVVDLTKPPPPEPEPAEEETPARLTAREEVMVPLRALAAAVATGSPVVARMIGHGLRSALRKAMQSPQPASPQKAADGDKGDDEGDDEGESEVVKVPAARESIGDLAERLALGALTIGVACTALSGVATVAWTFLAPYAGWVALGLAVAWCAAAAHFAPGPDAPANDHEMLVGEQPQEGDEEEKEARWAVAQESLRELVEHRATAIAGRHVEGIKGMGVPVDDLLAELQEKGSLPGVERKGFIELLEMAGITVREQMSFKVLEETPTGPKWKKKTPPGIHVEDLAESLGRTPRLPANLVPDLTPGSPSIPAQESAPDPGQIPTARAAGE
ncbi:hypothetical protein [Streptomyces parvulus]|uniref:hypothetical protein n=1 Tax=Streptomyces parvulus TaxID=146923 RepID=UPI00380BB556